MNSQRRFGLGFWLKMAILLGLVAMIWFNLDVLWETLAKDWQKFKRQLHEGEAFFDVPIFALSVAVYFVALLLTFYRWYILVRALGLPFTAADSIRLGFVGFVSSQLAPGSVTGDLVKMGFIAREQQQRTKAVATIIADRLIGLYALFLLSSLISVAFWGEAWQDADLRLILFVIWGATLVGAIGLVAVLAWPASAQPECQEQLATAPGKFSWLGRLSRATRLIAGLVQALRQYRSHPLMLAYATILSMVSHLGFVLSFYCCALALPLWTPSLSLHYLIIPIGLVAQAVPLVPLGNIGLNESVFGGLYKLVGANPIKGGFVSLAQRGVTWIVSLIGLIWYIPLRRAMHKAQATALREQAHLEPAAEPVPTSKDPTHETVS